MKSMLPAAMLSAAAFCGIGCGGDVQDGAHNAAGESKSAEVATAEPAASPQAPAPSPAAAPPSAQADAGRVSPRDRANAERVPAAASVGREPRALPDVPLPRLPAPAQRRAAPDLTVTDLGGRAIRLADLRGQAVLVTFWATWCAPCRQEIPHLVRWHETYGSHGLTILGISVDQQGLPVVRPFVKERPEIRYTIIPNGARAAAAFGGVERIPTAYLLDRQGRIVARFEGLPRGTEMEGHIQAVLRES